MLKYRENDVLNIPEKYKKMSLDELREEEARMITDIRANMQPPRRVEDIERKRSILKFGDYDK